ncbi:heterokaryon incompatibility protein-domain-containing protein [Xylariomycetidae sp. FL2044]|nr:heterokaryon incompatibility protein-domain-containing protein [Xylariomycetidae sp. FL2044]
MTYCAICDSLTISYLRSTQVVYHTNPPNLKTSAESGTCDFCRLCWTTILKNNSSARVDRVLQGFYLEEGDGVHTPIKDPRIWLEGMFRDQPANAGGGRFPVKPNDTTPPDTVDILYGPEEWWHEFRDRPQVLGKLSIFADPDTSAGQYFLGRLITSTRNPEYHIPYAKEWLRHCQENHTECVAQSEGEGQAEFDSTMPTRLIHVGNPSDGRLPRLVVPSMDGIKEPYVALSYVWGEGNRQAVKLHRENLDDLLEHLDETLMSRSQQEAMTITRGLGIGYLWIDSLCIVQGDREEWAYESTLMGRVYGRASVTLVAGRSDDSLKGFMENTVAETWDTGPCSLRVGEREEDAQGTDNGGPGIERLKGGEMVHLAPMRSSAMGPAETRAWCFQEYYLSKRTIVYGAEQITLRCQRASITEDGQVSRHDFNRLQQVTLDHLSLPRSEAAQLPQSELLRLWYRGILVNYSSRSLTEPNDIFAALSSIAQRLRATIQSRYLAGLWETDIILGLLWHPAWTVLPIQRFAPVIRSPVRRAPSWSWASVQGTIWERSNERNQHTYRDQDKLLVRPKYVDPVRWTADSTCDAAKVFIRERELEFFGRPRRARCTGLPTVEIIRKSLWRNVIRKLRDSRYLVRLEAAEESASGSGDPGAPGGAVAVGCYDIEGECESTEYHWCLGLTKEEGLLLEIDGNNRFQRIGTISILELHWMTAGPETHVRLV